MHPLLSRVVTWWQSKKAGAIAWAKYQAEYEPSDQENAVTGFLLFIFIVLWVLAGPR